MSQIVQLNKQAVKLSLVVLLVMVAVFACFQCGSVAAETKPQKSNLRVVASIKPIQLMIDDIRGKAGTSVILKNNQNHHLTTLKPSQRRLISDADIVFYVDEGFEVFLKKIIASEDSSEKYIALGDNSKLRLLGVRNSGEMPHTFIDKEKAEEVGKSEKKESDKVHAGHAHHGHESGVDWHIWLSPDNAIVMLESIRDTLSKVDPDNAAVYAQNYDKVSAELIQHSKQMAQKMKNVMYSPFFTLHDGYQYFEEQYGLQSNASILRHGEVSPSLKHMREVKKIQEEKDVQLILKEFQYSVKSIETLFDGDMHIINLDSLGQNLPDTAVSYVDFLKQFTNSIYNGLAYSK